MLEQIIEVNGMTCGHCEETVQKVIGAVRGVESVAVNLDSKQVTVTFDEDKAKLKEICDKITEAGFEVLD